MDKKILYVDMDNVLVDFQSGINQLSEEMKIKYDGRYDEVPGIFLLMKPIDKAIESYKILSTKYDTYILSTSPWGNPTAASDKLAWVKKYFGAEETDVVWKRLILTHHKNLNVGDYLIDDRAEKNGVDKFKGELLHFGKGENGIDNNYPNWDSVVEYLMNAI